MPDSAWVEGIKLVGGIAGLGTAVFTLWDRLFRSRPGLDIHIVSQADMVRLGLSPEMGTDPHLRILNPSNKAILVTSIQASSKSPLKIAFYNSIFGIVSAVNGSKHTALIPAKSDRSFLLTYDDEISEAELNRLIWISVGWRPVGALLPRIPVMLSLRLRTLTDARKDEWQRQKTEYEKS